MLLSGSDELTDSYSQTRIHDGHLGAPIDGQSALVAITRSLAHTVHRLILSCPSTVCLHLLTVLAPRIVQVT
jgi:hypothetical protein